MKTAATVAAIAGVAAAAVAPPAYTSVAVDTPVYTPAPPTYSTASCPAPGTTGSQGYSCNPAHQYPEGQQCNLSNGCYILTSVAVDVPAYTPAPTSAVDVPVYTPAPPTYTTASCPAPGTTGSQGYSCNPAHQYPEGQQCNLSNGCYILTSVAVDTPVYTPVPSSPVAPQPPVYTSKASGSVPPPQPTSKASGSVPPVAPSYTKPASSPSATPSSPTYTGAADNVVVGAGAIFAAVLAVFAL